MHEDEINSKSDDNNGKRSSSCSCTRRRFEQETQANALNVTFPHKLNRVSVVPGRTVNSLHHVQSAGAKK
jgi:hypothetical protein